MKVYIEKHGKEWHVIVNHGNQYFTLVDVGTKKREAQWLCDMFTIALKNHNKELKKRYAK